MKLLSMQEEIVLLVIWKLKSNAYGVTIREFISHVTGKYWSIGAIYVPLDRLSEKGFIRAYQGEAIRKRGGRSKRMYQVTDEGMKALHEMREVQNTLWEGFPELVLD